MGIYVHGEIRRGTCRCKIAILVPRLNNLGMRPQERSSLGTVSLTGAQCMRLSSIDMGLDYDSTVMLTCKLLFAAAKAIVDVGHDMPWQS